MLNLLLFFVVGGDKDDFGGIFLGGVKVFASHTNCLLYVTSF